MGNTGNTDVDMDEKGTWFWNRRANVLESDLECNGYSNKERDLGSKGSRIEEEALSQKQPREINWNKEGKENLRGVYR